MFASGKTSAASTSGYQISRSLRFNSADSAYLNRTVATTSNRQTFTFSFWYKLGTLGTTRYFYGASINGANEFVIVFNASGVVTLYDYQSGYNLQLVTTQVFRDPSAWYHFVFVLDTTQATSSNRAKIYVNGSQITAFSTATYPSQNYNTLVNSSSTPDNRIGLLATNPPNYLDGYVTEFNFIDGQALTPSSFGETNAQTSVWQPKAYSGSYGTNGFYLNFSDNSNTTAATLGKDYSGNGNNWTPNNFSVTAGAGNDSLVDSPTSYGTDTGVGGTVRGNYGTWNPLTFYSTGTIPTFTNGNLDVSVPASAGLPVALGTFVMPSGQWYWEVTITSGGAQMVGIANSTAGGANSGYTTVNGWYYYSGGQKYNNNVDVTYGTSFTVGDVIGVALDIDAGTLVFYKNGASQGTAYSTGLTGKTFVAALGNGASSTAQGYTGNFGQRAFANTAPSGFKALCTQNLPTPTIGATTATQAGKFFNTVTYTGTQTTQSVTGVGFQPDFVWNKDRSGPWPHVLTDVVRGVGKSIYTNSTDPEVTNDANGYLSAFNSDGFTLAGGLRVNASGDAIVAWNWKANGSGSTNTAGSITSTVSANTTSGFSIATYTGNGSAATIGHGLGVAPSMYIVKNRGGTADEWVIYHSSLPSAAYYLTFTTGSQNSNNVVFNSTAPTSTVFSVGTSRSVNTTTYVAYCFAEVAGYSKIGSFAANGSTDGPFVFCGFKPAFIIFKSTSAGTNWQMYDSKRNTYNVVNSILYPNDSASEATASVGMIDFTSNGFKVRNAYGDMNSSGTTIFMAFAETPLKFSLAR